MNASFVIVNYNRKKELLITIGKIKELISNREHAYEIIVVDNASIDGSSSALKSTYPDVIVIDNPVNTGAPAWNLGFAIATGDYFIILDDDSHIEFGLEDALAYMDDKPTTGVLALNVVTGPYTSEMWNWKKTGENIAGFIGCGAIIRAETYKKIGGYADWIFLYVNEWEYSLRCIDAGYKVVFFAESRVIHRASPINRSNKRLRKFVTMHELAIVYKHFSNQRTKYLFRVIINNLKFLKNFEFKNTWYNLLGMAKFLILKGKLKRTPVSCSTQKFFADNFFITSKSAFGFMFERSTRPKV